MKPISVACSAILTPLLLAISAIRSADPLPPAFTPLPLSEVKPAGWLKDWCEQAADGITGHCDELDPLFANGWMDANFMATSTGAQNGDKVVGYALEQAGYWIDCTVLLARPIDDEKLLARCHTRFETLLPRVEAGALRSPSRRSGKPAKNGITNRWPS